MKRLIAVFFLGIGVLTLSGCRSETLEERIENRQQCEAASGVYQEYFSGGWLYGEYRGWTCDLTSKDGE